MFVAVKIKKKSNKPSDQEILEQDDQILEASQDTFNWLTANRTLVLGLIAATVIGILAVTWFLEHRRNRIAEASAATYEALAITFQPVGENVEQPPEGQRPIPQEEIFATQQAKLEALRSKANEVVSAYENRRAGNEARLLEASAALELGDHAKALDGYETFRSTSDTRLGELVATLGEATSRAAAGNLEQGLSVIDGIMERYEGLRANLTLQKARLIDTYGESVAARTAYQELLDSDFPLASIDASSVETRIALLNIELGDTEEQPEANEENQDDGQGAE